MGGLDKLPHLYLYVACFVCGFTDSILNCGIVVPESPAVEIGKEFTATCVLYNDTKATADQIYWLSGNERVPKEYYNKINESAMSVTVNVTSDMNTLKCEVLTRLPSYKSKCRTVHGIFLEPGYPPEKPENLSCMVTQSGTQLSPNLTCKWDLNTRESKLPTNYTLCVNLSEHVYRNKAQKTKGYVDLSTFPSYMLVEVWVEVKNKLGKVHSDVLKTDSDHFVKTDPPSNVRITCEKEFPTSFVVQWKHPIDEAFIKLKYNIRFCTANSNTWSEVPPSNTQEYIESFRIQALKPYTDYVVQVRCMHHKGSGYWSDWSPNVTALTPEAKPSGKPDLWRHITPLEGKPERHVELRWKNPIESNGRILGQDIKRIVDTKFEESSDKFVLSNNKETTILLRVNNSAGFSPAARLSIPKVNKEPPPVETFTWTSNGEELRLKWQPPTLSKNTVSEYILEWVAVSDGEADWQREPGDATEAGLKGDLRECKRYNISIYPMYSERPGKPVTVAAYLKQGPPAEGPSVNVKKTGKHDVALDWKDISVDEQCGFITNYTIFYRTGSVVNSTTVLPDPHSVTQSFILRSLASDQKYEVKVMASTIQGSTNGSEFSFKTLKYAPGEIEAIVVGVCISFLFLTVLIALVCLHKREMIKKHIWPQVPDPSNSTIGNWSPDFPSRPVTPKEAPLADVSVVEVDVFERRSLSEEDRVSLPLKKEKYLSEEHSSGIAGSSCMSSPRQSVSDSDEGDEGQTTSSTVQYSSVVASGYKGQTPGMPPHAFARSESTQPLLECEEHLDPLQGQDSSEKSPSQRHPRNPYFKHSTGVPTQDSLEEEIRDPTLSNLGFSPVEEAQQSTGLLPEGSTDSAQSYMPQLSGYRPQH